MFYKALITDWPFFSGKKKRGRPKKVERKDDQDYVPPALMEEGSKDTQTPKPLDSKLDQANAVEGLLELSNTGIDPWTGGISSPTKLQKIAITL